MAYHLTSLNGTVFGGLVWWTKDRLAFGPTLVCPMRVLHRDYVDYCVTEELPTDSPAGFVEYLRALRGLRVQDAPAARGRLKRVVHGAGLIPKTGGKTCT